MKKNLHVGKSDIHGKGIFCSTDIKKGEHIAFISGTLKRFKSKSSNEASSIPTWYGINKSTWIDPGKGIFSFFNHSCDPNTAIIGTKKVVARRDIPAGTELTFDYSFTDADINWTLSDSCTCGSKNCRKIIRSIQNLSPATVKAHYPLIPKYFLNLYIKSRPDVIIDEWKNKKLV